MALNNNGTGTYIEDQGTTAPSTNAGTGGGASSGGGSSSTQTDVTPQSNPDAGNALNPVNQPAGISAGGVLNGLEVQGETVKPVDTIDVEPERKMLEQFKQSQIDQVQNQLNYATEKATRDLVRQEADAQEQFDTQRNQINTDEQRALDNQVLYNEARGDRGGIGQAQYNSIQNTAAVNRMTVNKEQTKLSNEVMRQVNDLRAQNDFESADKLLTITQNYLSQLLTLEQWAKEQNLSVEEFNRQLAEWQANYKLSVVDANINLANTTGAFRNGTLTYTAWKNQQDQMAAAANALMQAGVMPSAEQLGALGMSAEEAQKYVNYIRKANNITTAS